MRVGIIDDDLAFTDVMSDVLEDRGWDVVLCRDESKALCYMEQVQPDVILLDLRMETTDGGWNLLNMLRKSPVTSQIPVIICSADIPALRRQEAALREQGVQALDKPFDIDVLYATVEGAAGLTGLQYA